MCSVLLLLPQASEQCPIHTWLFTNLCGMSWRPCLGNLPNIPVLLELLPYLTWTVSPGRGARSLDSALVTEFWHLLLPCHCSWNCPGSTPCQNACVTPVVALGLRSGLPDTVLYLGDQTHFSHHLLWDFHVKLQVPPLQDCPIQFVVQTCVWDTAGGCEELVWGSPGTDCVRNSRVCGVDSENSAWASVQPK